MDNVIDTNRRFYERRVAAMISEEFPEYEDRIAVGIVGEGGYRTVFRTVVNEDNLSFRTAQGECEDAVQTLAKNLDRQLVVGDDKTHQRGGFLIVFLHTGAKVRIFL